MTGFRPGPSLGSSRHASPPRGCSSDSQGRIQADLRNRVPCLTLASSSGPPRLTVKSLGITLDSNVTMQDHIKKKTNNTFHSLKLLHKIKTFITHDDLKQATQALVLSRLDYGISILTGTAKSQLAPMRSTLHAAARLVTGIKKYDHISPALKSLNWLSIEARCSFRTACLTHKALHTGKAEYLAKKKEDH
ncbi:hypothetical protein NDU88_004145 [Pleurodeles waltl]|uniref:Uncharacterized protein n=1 Tax=Pleurodeles waltl TaxID=8319 RepID=A0AAV7N282_PLEWA|nr:hypothetical protein NDU88_004145 [Pleurodeles waltl]